MEALTTQAATPGKGYQLAVLLLAVAMLSLMGYAAWLSFDTGKRTPILKTDEGLTLSQRDLRQATEFEDIKLDQKFFFLIPEFRSIEDHEAYLNTHKLVWQQLQASETNELVIEDHRFTVHTDFPTTGSIMAKFGAIYAVATLFAAGGLIALWRHPNGAGRAAALFLFGAGLFALSLPALVTRGLTLPFDALETTIALYYIGSCMFIGLIYFPFVFSSSDLPRWIPKAVFWLMLTLTAHHMWTFFSKTTAIATYLWLTILMVALFTVRVVQRAALQMRERNITHLVLCYVAMLLPTMTFSAMVSWPELLAIELGGIQYFVLTSTVVPIAMISLLESELLQRRNEIQAQQLQQQQLETETRSQQARQTVIMNLHDHVARSLDSISALALRAKLAGDGIDRLVRIREHAMHAHRALRGLFSVSAESCDTWPALRVQLREFGNALVEHHPIDFQLNDWLRGDSDYELDASVKLIVFHVMSEAVTNAVKHGNPEAVVVDVGASENSFQLQIQDNGMGFDTSSIDNSRHHGLNIMRKRAQLISGELTIESAPNGGTKINLSGPLVPEHNSTYTTTD